MKIDMNTRNERAAKELAIETASRYLTSYVKLCNVWQSNCRELGIDLYRGSWGDCSKKSLSEQELQQLVKRNEAKGELEALNELEAIAAAFVTGVADEEVGFEIIGRTYVHSAVSHYPIICICSEKGLSYYSSIRVLTPIWQKRIEKRALLAEQAAIQESIDAIGDSRIKTIGRE